MSIEFFPLNIPFTSSRATNAYLTYVAAITSNTASFVEFSQLPVGPSGSNYVQVFGEIAVAVTTTTTTTSPP